MAKIEKVIINGLRAGNMGEATDRDAAGYREWVKAEFEREYPGVEIEANEADATYGVEVYFADGVDSEGDYRAERLLRDEAQLFAEVCWERCPWDWAE